jgi:hypothetical protein
MRRRLTNDTNTTKTGVIAKAGALAHPGGRREIVSPPYERDVALRLVREDGVADGEDRR